MELKRIADQRSQRVGGSRRESAGGRNASRDDDDESRSLSGRINARIRYCEGEMSNLPGVELASAGDERWAGLKTAIVPRTQRRRMTFITDGSTQVLSYAKEALRSRDGLGSI